MELLCSNCGAVIQAQDVNIAANMAKCSSCNSLLRASELREKVNISKLLQLPAGAVVQLQQGFNKSIELTVPAQGVTGEAIGLIIFSIFWLGFITVWTGFALFGGLSVMALFSIPFWIVGVFIVKSAFNKIFESQKLILDDNEVTIERIRPIFSNKITIRRSEITDVKYTDMSSEGSFASMAQGDFSANKRRHVLKNYPVIITKAKRYYFFNNLRQADQMWVVRLLKNVIVGN